MQYTSRDTRNRGCRLAADTIGKRSVRPVFRACSAPPAGPPPARPATPAPARGHEGKLIQLLTLEPPLRAINDHPTLEQHVPAPARPLLHRRRPPTTTSAPSSTPRPTPHR